MPIQKTMTSKVQNVERERRGLSAYTSFFSPTQTFQCNLKLVLLKNSKHLDWVDFLTAYYMPIPLVMEIDIAGCF